LLSLVLSGASDIRQKFVGVNNNGSAATRRSSNF
jgi:hypothetical protein